MAEVARTVSPRSSFRSLDGASFVLSPQKPQSTVDFEIAPVASKEEFSRLQVQNGDPDSLDPVGADSQKENDFDRVGLGNCSSTEISQKNKIEERSELIFSRRHSIAILGSPESLQLFSTFLFSERPSSIPLLED
mgnify:CR=1 FL=1